MFHFGIVVGMNFQDAILTNNGQIANDGKEWYATIPDYSPGFTVGIAVDMYLNPYMNLRFTPTLHFGDKAFTFVNKTDDEIYKTITKSNYLTAPLDLKIRTLRLNNYRPYLIAGVYGAMDLSAKKGEPILFKKYDFGFTIGIGCDFYLPIIKVAPELRFSFGFGDIFEKDRSDLTDDSLKKYPASISKGGTRMISLVFNFE